MVEGVTDSRWPLGEGEMAERMRRHAWNRTPLGPTETWPRRLVHAVELMLDAHQPIAIWWGREFVQLYNDAYREYLDPEHHSLLGASARDDPAPNWAILGPEIERVLAAGSATVKEAMAVPVFRFGRREDAWWTCAFNPIRLDGPKGIGGVLVCCNDVTVAHSHREAPLESGRQLQQLVRALSLATWETNTDGFVVNASPDWSAYTGQAPEQTLGYGWLDAVHPDDRSALIDQWQDCLRAGRDANFEYRVFHAGDGWRWTNARATPLRDSRDTIQKWIGINIDIDARCRTEGALRESEERQAFLLALSDVLRPIAAPLDIQVQACRLLGDRLCVDLAHYVEFNEGLDRSRVTQDFVRDDMPSVVGDYSLAEFSWVPPALRAGKPLVIADTQDSPFVPEADRAAVGALGLIACISIPLIKNGTLVGALVVGSRARRKWTPIEIDLVGETAERLWAAVERARAELALRDSEERFRSLFESMSQGYGSAELIRDGDGTVVDLRLLDVNSAFERLTGIGAETAVGRRACELFPEIDPELLAGLNRVERTGTSEHFVMRIEAQRWYAITAYRSGWSRIAVLFDDVTEAKRHEANLTFLAEMSNELARLSDIDETLGRLGSRIGEYFGVARVTLSELSDDHEFSHVAYEWRRDGEPSILGGSYRVRDFFSDALIAASLAGEVNILCDTLTDARVNGRQLVAHGTRSTIHVPLVQHGRWCFTISIAQPEPRQWRSDEVELMRELTGRIWTRLQRARAERAVSESERRLRALTEASSEAMYRMSPNWTELRQLDGGGFLIDASEPRRTWLTSYIPPDERTRVMTAVETATRGRTPFELEHRVVRADGSVGWALSRAVPVLDDRGDVLEWFGAASDVTDRRFAEETLRHSERRQAFLLTLSDALRLLGDPADIQAAAARVLRAHLGTVHVAYWETIDDESVRATAEDRTPEMPSLIGPLFRWDDFDSVLYQELCAGRAVWRNDVAKDATLTSVQRAAYADVMVGAWVIAPLVKDGTLRATLSVFAPRAREWTAGEISVVEETADRTWSTVERARSEAKLRESEEKYRNIFETTTQGYGLFALIRDQHGRACDYRILELNAAFEQHTGSRVVDCVGRTAQDVWPELEAFWILTFEQMVDSGEAIRIERFAPDTDRWFDIQGFPRGGDRFAVIYEDITKRKTIEAALRDSEARYRMLVENVRDYAMALLGPDGVVREWTTGAQIMFGYDADEIIGRHVSALLTQKAVAAGEHAIQLDEAAKTGRIEHEAWRVRKSGARFWADETLAAVYDDDDRLVAFSLIVRDPTVRRRTTHDIDRVRSFGRGALEPDAPQNRKADNLPHVPATEGDPEHQVGALGLGLQALLKESDRFRAFRQRASLRKLLSVAEEEERRRISRELHDEAGQHLAALGLGLQALATMAPAGSDIEHRAVELHALTGTLAAELHDVAVRLRPRVLDDFGLAAALEAYAQQWSKRSGIAIDVHLPIAQARLLPVVESAVYRIVQEALTNVARHSKAQHAGVVVERQGDYVQAIVEDDGGGFDQALVDDRHLGEGLGLLGIRERAELLGGTLEIESARGNGTTVFVRIPVTDAGEPATVP